eukprot:SAG25_NODE_3123_length_1209_cov_1.456757_1_plen_357_part_01
MRKKNTESETQRNSESERNEKRPGTGGRRQQRRGHSRRRAHRAHGRHRAARTHTRQGDTRATCPGRHATGAAFPRAARGTTAVASEPNRSFYSQGDSWLTARADILCQPMGSAAESAAPLQKTPVRMRASPPSSAANAASFSGTAVGNRRCWQRRTVGASNRAIQPGGLSYGSNRRMTAADGPQSGLPGEHKPFSASTPPAGARPMEMTADTTVGPAAMRNPPKLPRRGHVGARPSRPAAVLAPGARTTGTPRSTRSTRPHSARTIPRMMAAAKRRVVECTGTAADNPTLLNYRVLVQELATATAAAPTTTPPSTPPRGGPAAAAAETTRPQSAPSGMRRAAATKTATPPAPPTMSA